MILPLALISGHGNGTCHAYICMCRKEEKMVTNLASLVAKKTKAPVWQYFGFEAGTDKHPTNYDKPICRECLGYCHRGRNQGG